ncbi:MAG: HAD-IB family hydrolase [Myxococcota bacterium]|nr:HAD-IB family hydrolase [Myxococcota bacterium]
MSVAFFDLDRTLLSKNSGSLWVKREFKAGRISLRRAVQASIWLMRYHLGQANIEHALDHAVSTLAGKLEKDLERRTYQFYEEEIKHLYRPGALQAIEKHRKEGHQLVLLTSSSEYLSEACRKQLQLDDILCNRFDVDNEGYFTGDLIKPACYGKGKLVHANRYLNDTKGSLENCYFYTDSISDLPVLEAVGYPKIVAPDRKLRKEAYARGWPILDWSRESL